MKELILENECGDCGFFGDVTVTEYLLDTFSHAVLVRREWVCPDCGEEHEDELELTE